MTPDRIGPYRILERIGSGGMGHVYLAEHDEGGERVAVKVLTASLAREAGFVERFNREIDAMRKLDNPHIVKLLESGVDGENYYYAMEFVAGETMLALMRREKRLPWRQAIELAVQVCRALKSAHDAGIIHRDLKPSNLLLTGENFVKLTDFGVAQVFAGSRLTVTGGIIGTAEYMSPEQAQGKRASKQSDLYSLGALLYAMVTGRTPFSGSTAVEVIQKHKFGLFDRPSLFAPDLPQRVEDTICRLLEKDPAKRFPDALVLLRHLEQLVRLEDFAKGGITVVESSDVLKGSPTVAATPPGDADDSAEPSRQPGPATLMQGMLRAEIEEMNRSHWLVALFDSLFVQVAMLVLVVGGGVWWFWPREVSPQSQFDRGVALMQREAGPEWLQARREVFEPLVAADPETWRAKAAPYLERIELYELTRPSRGKRGKAPAGDSESQRLLQVALQYRDLGDFARAGRILTSLRTLLTDNEQDAKTYELAGRLIEELRKERGPATDRDRMLRESLTRADRLAAEGKAEKAQEVWRSLVDLYGDDPEAGEFVERAREGLRRELQRE